jgi:hypothetical protein
VLPVDLDQGPGDAAAPHQPAGEGLEAGLTPRQGLVERAGGAALLVDEGPAGGVLRQGLLPLALVTQGVEGVGIGGSNPSSTPARVCSQLSMT